MAWASPQERVGYRCTGEPLAAFRTDKKPREPAKAARLFHGLSKYEAVARRLVLSVDA
jgi:hypothetical protein